MKRTLAFLGSVVALALVVGATIVGATLAQPGQYGHIYAQAEGDDAVVAVVEGENITRGQVRKPAEFRRSNDSTMTESEAKQITILVLVEDTALWAEAKQRKLVPTDEEVRAYMQPHKEACLGPQGEECRRHIEDMGQTVANYWDTALSVYKKGLAIGNLYAAMYEDVELAEDADIEATIQARERYLRSIRDDAEITWNDNELKELYDRAVAEDNNRGTSSRDH